MLNAASKPLVAHRIQQALSALLYQGFCALWLLWQSRAGKGMALVRVIFSDIADAFADVTPL